MDELTERRRAWARLTATGFGVIVVSVGGYLGFVAFVGSDPQRLICLHSDAHRTSRAPATREVDQLRGGPPAAGPAWARREYA
jgi:hypothetical protein